MDGILIGFQFKMYFKFLITLKLILQSKISIKLTIPLNKSLITLL